MKVLLSHGYFLSEDPKEKIIMRPYPPLGILCLSAYLKQMGVDTSVYDTTFSTLDHFKSYLRQHRPRFLALYVNLMTKRNILAMMKFVREDADLNRTFIVLGGPEVRHHDEEFLRFGADVIVFGEGESTLHDVVTMLDGGLNPFWDTIEGIAYLNMAGGVVRTPEREKIKDLDRLPLPDRLAIDHQLYFDAWKQKHGKSAISINTMRGCPYTCKWCSRAVYGLSYRRRSPEKVVQEIQWIQKHYQVDTIWFVDDVFTVSHKWLKAFVDALQEAGTSISYECITRADRMNEEVVDLLAQSGCFRVWIGAESGSQQVLDAMDRRVEARQVRDMIRLSQAKGIQAGTFIMLGYPGETEADIVETARHLFESAPDLFTITVAYPIKGTDLYESVEKELITDKNWEERSDRDLDFPRTYPRRYYDHAVRWVTNWVHASLAWRKKQYVKSIKFRSKAAVAWAGMLRNRS